MANGLTAIRRRRHAKAIKRWRPWERSTGPRTSEGKARVARNAYHGGERQKVRVLAKQRNALIERERTVSGAYGTTTRLAGSDMPRLALHVKRRKE